MPTTADYSTFYYLAGTPGTGFTINTNYGFTPNQARDTADGTADGFTAVGDQFFWFGGSYANATLVGFSSTGEPVVAASPGEYYLLSNTMGMTGAVPFTTAGGPYAYCFAAGTRIATPTGEVAVETLETGSTILTGDGRAVPVKWLGRQTVVTRFGPPERLLPIRLQAGALGDGLPHTDLTVTADHALLIEGFLCHAGALVNGTTIARVPLAEMGGTYTVYHIETEDHEIIFANGAPAETFIDTVTRRAFDNFAEFDALYGDVPEMQELALPRAMSARQVPDRIRRKLGTLIRAA